MKVKNGIASSRSLDMMPKTRSGRAWRKAGENSRCSMAMTAEEQADGGEREGDRIADQQEDDQPPEHHGGHHVEG